MYRQDAGDQQTSWFGRLKNNICLSRQDNKNTWPITSIDQLDRNGMDTYSDCIIWKFEGQAEWNKEKTVKETLGLNDITLNFQQHSI